MLRALKLQAHSNKPPHGESVSEEGLSGYYWKSDGLHFLMREENEDQVTGISHTRKGMFLSLLTTVEFWWNFKSWCIFYKKEEEKQISPCHRYEKVENAPRKSCQNDANLLKLVIYGETTLQAKRHEWEWEKKETSKSYGRKKGIYLPHRHIPR